MALSSGSTLGSYTIIEPLGKGGMGEVYRARDATLGRDVAIKILPPDFADDQERLLRFEREARLLASISHPNIAVVHGFNEDEGQRYLVLEFIEGETLGKRLQRGPLHLEDVLEIGKHIADALAAAHDKGVVHRDLKPGNVMVNDDGAVKVLDFGLARTTGDDASSISGASNSPTITAHYTKPGVVLGSAAYMSPEQARGRPVDKRSDIWSFGVILFECLTGQLLFAGETPSDSMGAIIHKEPDWDTLPPETPQSLQQLLRRCLAKDRKRRLHDIADARIELEDVEGQLSSGFIAQAPTAAYPSRSRGRGWPMLAGTLALMLALCVAGLAWTVQRQQGGTAPRLDAAMRVTGMEQMTDRPGAQHSPSLAPNGRQFLYVERDGGDDDIFLQRVGGEKRINLTADHAGYDGQPAFSPDGERIAYRSAREGGGIFVMGATGESPRRITSEGFHPSWSPDGTRLACTGEFVTDPYSRSTLSTLWIVEIATGQRTRLSPTDAVTAQWSPDGRRLVYWAATGGQRDIWVVPSTGGTPVQLTDDTHTDWNPLWTADGCGVLFISDRGGTPDLWQLDFDPESGMASGEPRPLTTGVSAVFEASSSRDGRHLAIMIKRSPGRIERMAFDREAVSVSGTPETLLASAHVFVQMDVSDDGAWLAYRTSAPREDIFVMRTDGTGRRRLTNDVHRDRGPQWSPDGKWIVFYSNRSGSYDYWAMRRDGTDLKRLTNTPPDGDINQPHFMPDGVTLLGTRASTPPTTVFLVLDRSIEDIDAPLELSERTIPGFYALHPSPDGRYLFGESHVDGLQEPACYDLREKRLILMPAGPGLVSRREAVAQWLDTTRLAVRGVNDDFAGIWDVPGGTVTPWAGPPGRGYFQLVGDELYVNSMQVEADIWLLALGGPPEP